MARKVDEAANFVFMQLIKLEPGIYDKRHPDCAKLTKLNSVAFSSQANYTDRATAACWRS
jgi:hypothetical protein